MSREIWIICDADLKCNSDFSKGMISKAYELGQQSKHRIVAVCFGKQTNNDINELFFYGVDSVFHIDNDEASPEIFYKLLRDVISKKHPEIIMFSATDFGKRLASYVSVDFEAGLTAECIEIDVNNENEFDFKRAAINASAIATIQCVNSDLKLCSIKENIFIPKKLPDPKEIVIEEFVSSEKVSDDFKNLSTILKKVKTEKEEVDINSSNIVFGMGRGIKDKKNVDLLFKVANKIGAAVVGTRAVVEDKLIEYSRQVGQSGKSIAPEVYIAFGISGASQHIVGIKNAKVIVSVNTDENAPISDYADYIIKEEAEKVLSKLDTLF